jgi:hypothetical protein
MITNLKSVWVGPLLFSTQFRPWDDYVTPLFSLQNFNIFSPSSVSNNDFASGLYLENILTRRGLLQISPQKYHQLVLCLPLCYLGAILSHTQGQDSYNCPVWLLHHKTPLSATSFPSGQKHNISPLKNVI